MESLKEDQDLADVEIVVNNRKFRCHKAFLAAISPYFRAMFTGGMIESRQNRVVLQVCVIYLTYRQFISKRHIQLLCIVTHNNLLTGTL